MQLQYYSAIIEDILEKQKQISSLESILIKLKVGKQDQLIRGVKTVEGNDESLYCHGNLIIPLIKRGMMSDYAHVNHASVSVHNH